MHHKDQDLPLSPKPSEALVARKAILRWTRTHGRFQVAVCLHASLPGLGPRRGQLPLTSPPTHPGEAGMTSQLAACGAYQCHNLQMEPRSGSAGTSVLESPVHRDISDSHRAPPPCHFSPQSEEEPRHDPLTPSPTEVALDTPYGAQAKGQHQGPVRGCCSSCPPGRSSGMDLGHARQKFMSLLSNFKQDF